jgi:hypothetical protein
MTTSSSFIEALHAHGPAADRAKGLGLYAFLVGRWEMDAFAIDEVGTRHTARGEIHAGWVLAGRAIQDVWIVPARDAPPADPKVTRFYGTTLRVYDPGLDAWHITWIDPVTGTIRRQLGRARGADIVQEGEIDGGGKSRWSFTEITPGSFHWLGERSLDGGTTWRLLTEYLARRVGPGVSPGGQAG